MEKRKTSSYKPNKQQIDNVMKRQIIGSILTVVLLVLPSVFLSVSCSDGDDGQDMDNIGRDDNDGDNDGDDVKEVFFEFEEGTFNRVDLDKFTLDLPLEWRQFHPEFTDGFFGGFTNENDTIYFDYGLYALSSIDDIEKSDGNISFEELKIGGFDSKIILEQRPGEISVRYSLFTDKRDGENLNWVYSYNPKDVELIRKIFLTHRFK